MNFYFLGIAGAGMSALASVLASQGHRVTGSDSGVFPPISDYLDARGIVWRDGFEAGKIPRDLDAAIIGSSAKLELDSNPELAELIRLGIPQFGFAEYLGRYTWGRDNLVITGSFGKSTLTALCAVLLRDAGRDPGYFIGAVPLDLDHTGYAGSDPTFLIEGDEYVISATDRRSKFALYHPKAVLISSLIHDHVNVFPTLADYERPFAELIANLPAEALLVCAHAFEGLHRLTQERKAGGHKVVWYGRDACPGYYADNLLIGEISRFDLVTPGGLRIALETELLGLHNIENLVGAAALLLERGEIDQASLQRGTRKFRGVARRLDKKTQTSRVPVYEGFGSSYEKARSAIEAIALHFPDRPAIVIFEPHTFSWRNAQALVWYDTVFAGVSRVLVLPPPGHGAHSHDQLSQSQIADRIAASGVSVRAVADGDAVLSQLDCTLAGDEVVLLLSSGPLDGLAKSLPVHLDSCFS